MSSVSTASGSEVETRALRRERVRLVDEEDAVECAAGDAVRLDRRHAHVLRDETASVDLDEMATAEQPDRAVHLGEQPRHRRLARARVAEKDEVLAGGDLGEPALLAERLHLEEGDESAHLLLHPLEADQRIELPFELLERPGRLLRAEILELGDAELLPDRPQSPAGFREWIPGHRAFSCPRSLWQKLSGC